MIDVPEASDAATEVNPELLIEEMLGDPVPPDWSDPAAIAARTGHLEAVAALAGTMLLEALVYTLEFQKRGRAPQIDAPPTTAAGNALLSLHQALIRYTHDTRHYDGMEVAWQAMESAVGGDIAARMVGVLQRFTAELEQRMLEHARSSLTD
jgi:hypothetical protein